MFNRIIIKCVYNEYYENTGEIRPAEDYFNDIYSNGTFDKFNCFYSWIL